MPLNDILVLVMLVLFVGAIAWVSLHSNKRSPKDDREE